MKILLLGAELFHADGQTVITKPIFSLGNFANAPVKCMNEEMQIRLIVGNVCIDFSGCLYGCECSCLN